MRLKIVAIRNTEGVPVNQAFTDLIAERCTAGEAENTLLVDNAPDVVHIFGPWTWGSYRVVAHYRKFSVPVVFTSLDALQALADRQKPSRAMKKILGQASMVHVSGHHEQQILKDWCPQTSTTLILNPALTASTNHQKALSECLSLYNKVIADNEQTVKQAIATRVKGLGEKDESINAICQNILFAHHYYKRGFLPMPILKELSTLLTTRDYDEGALSKAIDRLQTRLFAARMMQVLHETTNLTEGFMPIESLSDKQTGRMTDMVMTDKESIWLT